MIEQKSAASESEVDINNPLHPLHISNRDLRIVPENWQPSDADPNDVLTHYDLRLKPVVREEPWRIKF